MKKIIRRIFGFIMVFGASLFLVGCQNNDEKTYVTIETNPSIEMIVDSNNRVIAINGLNDEGKMLLTDEDVVGKKLDVATKKVVELTVELGYVVEGEATDTSRPISISVSGSVEADASKLAASVKASVDSAIKSLELDAKVQLLESKGKEYFEKIAIAYDPSLTAEEAKEMSYADLLNVVHLATLEKAEFASIQLEKYYQNIKDYEFNLKYKQELVGALDNSYVTLRNAYTELLNKLTEAMQKLEAKKVELLTSAESSYVKALEKFNDCKAEYLDIQVQIAVKNKKGESTAALEVTFGLKELALSAAENTLKLTETAIEGTFDTLIAGLNLVYNQLAELEKQFPETIDFEAKLTAAENYINSSKDELFEKFESSFGEEKIETIKNDFAARKAALKAKVAEAKK